MKLNSVLPKIVFNKESNKLKYNNNSSSKKESIYTNSNAINATNTSNAQSRNFDNFKQILSYFTEDNEQAHLNQINIRNNLFSNNKDSKESYYNYKGKINGISSRLKNQSMNKKDFTPVTEIILNAKENFNTKGRIRDIRVLINKVFEYILFV